MVPFNQGWVGFLVVLLDVVIGFIVLLGLWLFYLCFVNKKERQKTWENPYRVVGGVTFCVGCLALILWLRYKVHQRDEPNSAVQQRHAGVTKQRDEALAELQRVRVENWLIQEKWEEMLAVRTQGLDLLAQKKYQEALPHLNTALMLLAELSTHEFPLTRLRAEMVAVDLRAKRAEAFMGAGDYAAAVVDYEILIHEHDQSDYLSKLYRFSRAEALFKDQQWRRALPALEELTALGGVFYAERDKTHEYLLEIYEKCPDPRFRDPHLAKKYRSLVAARKRLKQDATDSSTEVKATNKSTGPPSSYP